jgi:hypothetical protein
MCFNLPIKTVKNFFTNVANIITSLTWKFRYNELQKYYLVVFPELVMQCPWVGIAEIYVDHIYNNFTVYSK